MSRAIIRPRSGGNDANKLSRISTSENTITTTTLDFSSEQDKVWVDVEIRPGTDVLGRAIYNQQYTLALLDDPEEYYCTVTRFSLPTSVVPSLIPQFQSGSTTITVYSVTMTYNGNTYTQPVIYVPGSGLSSTSEFYPFIYHYDSFLTMINTAIATAFSHITPPMGSQPCYFQYDPVTKLISLVGQIAFYDQTLALPIQLYTNGPLFTLLSGFAGTYRPTGIIPPISTTLVFLYAFYDQKNNWYNPSWVVPSNPPLYYRMEQNFSNLTAWSPLKSIRLTTTSLPIKKEYITQISSGNVSGVGVLQDFIPIQDPSDPSPVTIQYVAQQYHLVDMAGHVPVSRLDFTFVWVDGDGVEHPIFIPTNGIVALQLAFFKKSTYTS